jgi:nucleoside-diphosphate-sugar epimerase
MSSYLVTGGAGFIGSHLAESLVRRGERVRVLDNFLTGKKENIQPFIDGIEFLEADIRSMESCRKAVEGVDHVLHQAALPSVPRSVEDPATTNDINISGTLNMLVASKEASVKSFVFASSSSVYGDDPRLPKKEGNEGQPLPPYGLSKITCEKYCGIFSREFGLNTVCLRYFNVFGPRQDPDSQYAAVIPNFISKALRKKPPVIYGDGEQSRDFTFVSNIVEANLRAVEKADRISGEILNLAVGTQTTVNELVDLIRNILCAEIEPIYESPRPGDIRHSFADITRLKKNLDYEPKVSTQQGLEATVEWYRNRTKNER